MSVPISVLSSKATQAVLDELVRSFETTSGYPVTLESIGGVDATARVRRGETLDVAVLSRAAIDELSNAGCLVGSDTVDVVRSGVAVAVRFGSQRPDVSTEEALRRAVLAAGSIGISTGPSGKKFGELLDRWEIAGDVRSKLVVAPPGIAVGALLARGTVELGFQQLSELQRVDGIDVLGLMPEPVRIITTFSASLSARSRQPVAARALLAFLTSSVGAEAKRRHGMEPA